MTALKTGTPVSAPLTPGLDDTNIWPTHIAKYGSGGFEIVEDDNDLNAITDDRKEDKVVYIKTHGADLEPALLFWNSAAGAWEDLDLSTVVNPASQSGIEFDDGTTNAASVTKVNLKGAKVTQTASTGSMAAGEIEVTNGINWHMLPPSEQYGSSLATEVIVEPPLSTYVDPNTTGAEAVRLGIAHGTFEPLQPPSYLAYLAETEEVVGKSGQTTGHHDGALWFDDVVVPSGAYIQTDKPTKAYGLQEADELDPNVSGGTDYLVAFRAAFKGLAPDDGFVRIYLHEEAYNTLQKSKIIRDVNGHLMAYERFYKKGEVLGALEVVGVVNAKGLTKFTCHVVDDFTDDTLNLEDRTEGGTGLMIQAVKSNGKTGNGLQQFEIDTNQNLEFSAHYLGVDRMNLDWILHSDIPIKEGEAGTGQTMTDGFHFYNISKLKAGVKDGHLHIEDNGVDLCDFTFGKIFSAEETQMLRGKEVDLTVTLIDQHDGYKVGLMKWTGKPNEYTPEIFTTRNNGIPNFQTNWTQVDEKFISENISAGDHSEVKTFTVPSDANNYAVIIYPVAAQTPVTLRLKQFRLDVVNPFVGYAIKAPELDSEKHLYYSNGFKKLVQDAQGYASLRYTLNNVAEGLPMPVGELGKGNASITLDSSVNAVPGSSATGGEGAITFGEDGEATISTDLLLWNEKDVDSVVNFWYARVGPGNQFTKITDSGMQAVVKAEAKGTSYSMPTFKLDIEKGDKVVLLGKADSQDGAYLKAINNGKPLLSTAITFKELVVSDSGDDPWADLDMSQFEHVYEHMMAGRIVAHNTSNISTNFTVPENMYIDIKRGIKKLPDGTIRPLKNMDFSYKDGLLKVSFGEVVDEARILIGVYL